MGNLCNKEKKEEPKVLPPKVIVRRSSEPILIPEPIVRFVLIGKTRVLAKTDYLQHELNKRGYKGVRKSYIVDDSPQIHPTYVIVCDVKRSQENLCLQLAYPQNEFVMINLPW